MADSFLLKPTLILWSNDIVSLIADNKAILEFGASGLALASVAELVRALASVLRVGLVRALSLAFRSYFKSACRSGNMRSSNLIQGMKIGRYYCYW
jgi:hypothetical protein